MGIGKISYQNPIKVSYKNPRERGTETTEWLAFRLAPSRMSFYTTQHNSNCLANNINATLINPLLFDVYLFLAYTYTICSLTIPSLENILKST